LVALEAIVKTNIKMEGDISFGGVVSEIEQARLSRNPHECHLYLDIRTVPGQTIDS
jgi:hypothetical protein